MEKKRAIVFLNEAMQEVYVLETLPHNNNEYPTWYQTIEGVLFKVFGKDSIEYKTFKEAGKIWGLVEDAKTEYLKALRSREAALASIIKTHEILGDEEHAVKTEPKDTAGLPVYLFDRMQFHPRVITSSKSLFETGHYSQAIFEAFKAVNNFVKEKSGLSLDGKDLMAKVFREEDLIIKLNKLKTKSERDEQDGFKFLYMGAMVGIRNPKAHDNVVQTDPYRTLEYLGFASLLMKRVDEGELTGLQKNA